jgi:hypothetical protein
VLICHQANYRPQIFIYIIIVRPMDLNPILFNAVNKRASKQVYKVFNINKAELELLCSMIVSLERNGKKRLGIQPILRDHLYNPFYSDKDMAIFFSILKKGFISQGKVNSGVNYSISGLGESIIRYYDECTRQELKSL